MSSHSSSYSSSGSSSGHRTSSSSRDRERDEYRDRDYGHRDSYRDSHRDSNRDRDYDRNRDSHKDRDYRRDDRDRDSYRDSYRDNQGERSSRGFSDAPPSNHSNSSLPPAQSHSNRFDRGGNKEADGWEKAKDTSSEVDPFANVNPSNTGIDFDKYDSIPVEVSGRDAPAAITGWDEARGILDRKIMENIDKARYTKPTPVQKNSIPIVTRGRDLMGCAQTGSGKTAAFLIPILGNILKVEKPRQPQGEFRTCPRALVLAPTRELAVQIYDEALKFSHRTGIRCSVVYGGSNMGQQIREIRGCDLLVATPGRLNDMVQKRVISFQLITNLVLDEADRMLDMGFEPQIREIVEKADMPTKDRRQTLMFSATFPKEIQRLASTFLSDYVFLAVGRVGATAEMVTQKFVQVEEYDKEQAIMNTLKQENRGLTLIFVETKVKVQYVEQFLRRNGFKCTSIHGDREQNQRTAALKSFSKGETPILIATNVAARGLDIGDITHVINVDMPANIDDYVHRIGRTGRAGKKGTSTTFITSKNLSLAGKLCDILEEAKQEVPPFLLAQRGRSSGPKRGGHFGGKDFRRKEYSNDSSYNSGGNYGHSQGGYNQGSSSHSGYGGGNYGSSNQQSDYGNSNGRYSGSSQSSSHSGYDSYNNNGQGQGSNYHVPVPPSNGGYSSSSRDDSRKRHHDDRDSDESSSKRYRGSDNGSSNGNYSSSTSSNGNYGSSSSSSSSSSGNYGPSSSTTSGSYDSSKKY